MKSMQCYNQRCDTCHGWANTDGYFKATKAGRVLHKKSNPTPCDCECH